MEKLISILMALSMLVTGILSCTQICPYDVDDVDQVKNVILFIGDGMGENHLEWAKDKLDIELAMETFPLRGQSKTRSANWFITDSAAGGTALSSGIRTGNGYIGVYFADLLQVYSTPTNITEICESHGMRTGVITTDLTTGATPSSFSAHTSDRDNNDEIIEQQMASDIDIIWGNTDELFVKETAEANGFTVIESEAEMDALENGSKSFAAFDSELWNIETGTDDPTLSEMTEKAIEILDNDEEGFFLMVEGAHIDKHSHSNDEDKMVVALREFDKAVEKALEFAEADGETLIVITADHETGKIVYKNGEYKYTRDSHSASNVPVFVYGSSNFIENGEAINNYMVPRLIASSLGFEQSEFRNVQAEDRIEDIEKKFE